MILTLCMAGLYSRFKNQGYQTPKFLLPLEDQRTMLEVIVSELLKTNTFDDILLVMNRRDQEHEGTIRDLFRRAKFPEPQLMFIGDTLGQAETARLAAEFLLSARGSDASVLFHNIDTIIRNRRFRDHDMDTGVAGVIDVFESSSPAYSYVRTDADGVAVEMKEKVVISSHATSGAYYFTSMREYLSVYASIEWKSERYISQIYQAMMDLKRKILILPARAKDTIVLGTPLEYETYLKAKHEQV